MPDRYPGAPFFVVPTPNANVVELGALDVEEDRRIQETFPAGCRLHRSTIRLLSSVESIHSKVSTTVLIAVLLVVLVVYVFLQSWRATIIPVVAIPVSLIGAFTILTILGGSVNNLVSVRIGAGGRYRCR